MYDYLKYIEKVKISCQNQGKGYMKFVSYLIGGIIVLAIALSILFGDAIFNGDDILL